MNDNPVRRFSADFRWSGVDVLNYKAEGTAPFRDVTRQVLFGDETLECQLRYFEVQPHGYSTLERHQHTHAVMIVRGGGRCLIGDQVHDIAMNDLITIPMMTWHQFRAAENGTEPLGFLCMVNAERDKPQLPSEADLRQLRANPRIADFIRT